MAEVFTKLMDSNAKLDILKVALQKYQVKLGISVLEAEKEQKFTGSNFKLFSLYFIFFFFSMTYPNLFSY